MSRSSSMKEKLLPAVAAIIIAFSAVLSSAPRTAIAASTVGAYDADARSYQPPRHARKAFGGTSSTTVVLVNGKIDAKDVTGLTLEESLKYLSQEKGNESTILADVIFTESYASTADSLSLPLETLRSYGYGDGKTGSYGHLASGSANTDNAGSNLADRVAVMFENGWILGKPKSENTVVDLLSNFYNAISGDKSTLQGEITAKGLMFASLAAGLYDVIMTITSAIYYAISSIDLPVLLGLTDPSGIAAPAATAAPDDLVSSMLTNIFNSLGFDLSLVETASVITKTIFITMFFVLLLAAFMKAKNGMSGDRQRLHRSFGFFFRAIVIISSVFIIFAMTDFANLLNDFTASAKNTATRSANSQIVDTLKWAALDNFYLEGSFTDTSDTNVAKLTDKLEGRSASVSSTSLTSAAEMVGALASGETFTVNDWLGAITNSENSVASRSVRSLTNPVYFFYSPDEEKDLSISEMIEKAKDGGDGSDIDVTKIIEKELGIPVDIDDDKAYITVDGTKVLIDKKRVIQVSSRTPQSYLYGAWAGSSLPVDAKNIANYLGLQSSQHGWRLDELGASGDSEARSALITNAARLAVLNKFAGANATGTALSNQSVMFLLQSSYNSSTGTLLYQGVNTTPSDTGAGKDTGRDGAKMVRYVIPSSSDEDLATKCWHITVSWIGALIVAAVALVLIIKLPLLNCIYRMVRGIVGAMLTGNVFDLADYVLFYIAMRLSFVFAFAASSLGIGAGALAGEIVDALGLATGSTLSGVGTFDPLGFIGGSITGFICEIAVVALVSGLLVYPMMKIPKLKGSRKGQIEKVCVLELVMSIPFIMAETLSESFRSMEEYVYGRKGAASRLFGRDLHLGNARKNTLSLGNVGAMTKKDHEDMGKEALAATASAVGTGVFLAGTAATGGAGALAAELGTAALKKVSGTREFEALPDKDDSLAALGVSKGGPNGPDGPFSSIKDELEIEAAEKREDEAVAAAKAESDASMSDVNTGEEKAKVALDDDAASLMAEIGENGPISTADADEAVDPNVMAPADGIEKDASMAGPDSLKVGSLTADKLVAEEVDGDRADSTDSRRPDAAGTAIDADNEIDGAAMSNRDRLMMQDDQYKLDVEAAEKKFNEAFEAANGDEAAEAAALSAYDKDIADAQTRLVGRNKSMIDEEITARAEAERSSIAEERDAKVAAAMAEAKSVEDKIEAKRSKKEELEDARSIGIDAMLAANDKAVAQAVAQSRADVAAKNFSNADSLVAKMIAAGQVAMTGAEVGLASAAVKHDKQGDDTAKAAEITASAIRDAARASMSPDAVIAAANAGAKEVERAINSKKDAKVVMPMPAPATQAAPQPAVQAASESARDVMDRERELKAMEELSDAMRDMADGHSSAGRASAAAADLEQIRRDKMRLDNKA